MLDVIFPRLTGGLVAALNRKMFEFEGIAALPDELIAESMLQKAMHWRAVFFTMGQLAPKTFDKTPKETAYLSSRSAIESSEVQHWLHLRLMRKVFSGPEQKQHTSTGGHFGGLEKIVSFKQN